MRKPFVALMMLTLTAGIASAQQVVVAAQNIAAPGQTQEVRVTPDDVIARLLFFDRNHDGKVTVAELSDRMQRLVARGDASGDRALDAAEIYGLAVSPQELVTLMPQPHAASAGGYGFGDTVGQSSRLHIDNTIDDLRLPATMSAQAKRIGQAFADEMDAAARAHLREAMAPLLMPDAFAQFDADLARLATTQVVMMTSNDGSPARTFMIGGSNNPTLLVRRYQFGPEQLNAATAAMETFKAEQQLDDARRSALVARLGDVLNGEDCDDVRAALARRPIVKGAGTSGVAGGVVDLERMLVSMQIDQGTRSAASSAR